MCARSHMSTTTLSLNFKQIGQETEILTDAQLHIRRKKTDHVKDIK